MSLNVSHSPEPQGKFLTKLSTKHPWMKAIQVWQALFQGNRDITEIEKI